MNIKSITVLNTRVIDIIILNTDLPNPIWPFTGNAFAKIESATSKTDEFIAKNFPNIPVEKIKTY